MANAGRPDQPACLDLSRGRDEEEDPVHTCMLKLGDDRRADAEQNMQKRSMDAEQLEKCLMPSDSPERKRTIFLLGDSHSSAAYPGLFTAVRGKFQIRHADIVSSLAMITLSAQNPLMSLDIIPDKKVRESVQKMVDGFLEPGDVIVLGMYTSLPEVRDDPEFIAEYISFLHRWGASVKVKNATLVVLGDNHGFEIHHNAEGTNPHICMAGALMSKKLRERCFPAREAWGNSSLAEAVRKAQPGSDWLLFEAAPPFCYRDHCGPFIPGTDVMAYRDLHHLNDEGSKFLAPFICAFFQDHALFED